MHPNVIVLLGTYNGAKFLREQLDSLLKQSHKSWKALVRDDGSTDETWSILEDYARRYPEHFVLSRGDNLGFVGNFLTLVKTAPSDADAYFFCDQDDIWLPRKIEQGLHKIFNLDQSGKVPVLYFGRLTIVDEALNTIGLSPLIARWSLGNALFENPMTGCTMALNRPAFIAFKDTPPEPARVIAHDWWAYLLVNALGLLVFDPEPLILYRQHGSNSLGAPRSRWHEFRTRWQNFRQGRWAERRPEPMVAHFLDLYRDRLEPAQRELIEVASLQRRGLRPIVWLWLRGTIWRRGIFNECLLAVLLLCRPTYQSARK